MPLLLCDGQLPGRRFQTGFKFINPHILGGLLQLPFRINGITRGLQGAQFLPGQH